MTMASEYRFVERRLYEHMNGHLQLDLHPFVYLQA